MQGYLAENLKYLRTTRTPPYTQRELADKLGVGRNAYGRYERGAYIPPLWFLYKVAAFYDIELSRLLSENLARSEQTKNENITQRDQKTDQ